VSKWAIYIINFRERRLLEWTQPLSFRQAISFYLWLLRVDARNIIRVIPKPIR